jgi:hypothetical protein
VRNFGVGVAVLIAAAAVSGCTSYPQSAEDGRVQVADITASIECELAAVARKHKLTNWGSKSSLDLTLVETVGVDGKVAWTIPVGIWKATPSAGLSGKKTTIAHLDFATSIEDAMVKQPGCVLNSDPSETNMGLAGWLEATLLALPDKGASGHGGMSYTREFQVTASLGSRFGYKLHAIDADFGPALGRVDTNRLTVAVAPISSRPTRVVIVGDERQKGMPNFLPDGSPQPRPRSPRPRFQDDPTLNRLLLQRAPVRIED